MFYGGGGGGGISVSDYKRCALQMVWGPPWVDYWVVVR
jgi:hypothetical protein